MQIPVEEGGAPPSGDVVSPPSNPSYELQIASSGGDTGAAVIKQTFAKNGALWAADGVALSISAYRSVGTAPPLTGFITYTGSSAVDRTAFTAGG